MLFVKLLTLLMEETLERPDCKESVDETSPSIGFANRSSSSSNPGHDNDTEEEEDLLLRAAASAVEVRLFADCEEEDTE